MTERALITHREAVLTSLLVHACLVIVILLFPGVFRPGEGRPPQAAGRSPIPVAFQMEPDPPESRDSFFGDSGKGRSSEPRPASEPPPTNSDPYSRGNTPNRFVAPPSPLPPAPQPGAGADAAMAMAEPPPPSRRGEARGGAAESLVRQGESGSAPAEGDDASPAGGAARGASDGAKSGDSGEGRPSLRERLGQMSAGGGILGGAPLRFDNPSGGLSGPQGGLSFETSGFDWGPYARKIYWVIYNNWIRSLPPAAWAGFKGMVTVKFRIQKDGRVTDIHVVAPSGTPAYDRCATTALEASDPLPALPDDFTKESEGVTARFIYDIDAWER